MSKRIYSKEEVIYDRQQNVSRTGSTGRTLSLQPHRRQPTGEDGRVKEERKSKFVCNCEDFKISVEKRSTIEQNGSLFVC